MTATVSSLPVWPADVPVHPAAELFPLMGGNEFAELVNDIKENGLVTPIVRTPDGLILDGRNRYRACLAAGVGPVYEEHGGEPWRFVISTNLYRRHLTDSQRAMVAGKIAERVHGSNRFQAKVDPPNGDSTKEGVPPTQAEAADLLRVSRRQVERARVVVKNGTPDLIAAVESGAVPVSTAERLTTLPPERQNEFAQRMVGGEKPAKAAKAAALKPPVAVEPKDDGLGWVPGKGDSSPKAVVRRRELIEMLAKRGWSSEQIEDRIGMLAVTVRKVAREEGIVIPADDAMRNTRKGIDSNRIVRETVLTLDGVVMGVGLVNVNDLDRAEVEHWSKSLTESLRALNRLIKQMKELDQ